MELLKLYSFYIKDRKNKIQGILLSEGDEWILIKNNFDYILDGYLIINKQYLLECHIGEDEIFTEAVLLANNKLANIKRLDIPLTTKSLINYLYKEQIIFQIFLKDDSASYIGKISKVLNKSIYIEPLDTNGLWMNERFLFRTMYIRVIQFDIDYINSLLNYNHYIENKLR